MTNTWLMDNSGTQDLCQSDIYDISFRYAIANCKVKSIGILDDKLFSIATASVCSPNQSNDYITDLCRHVLALAACGTCQWLQLFATCFHCSYLRPAMSHIQSGDLFSKGFVLIGVIMGKMDMLEACSI